MAALIRHSSIAANACRNASSSLATANATVVARLRRDDAATTATMVLRHKSKFAGTKMKPKVKTSIESTGQSLAARGFLRPYKSYEPPTNASIRLDGICEAQAISTNDDTELRDLALRFKLFVACEEEFSHSIPNSLLHDIETIGDLRQFYLTPVDITTPYEALRTMELPKNLHVQQDYHRFHPDTDTMFNGKTAFPKSSTIVTGLKYKKKYPGHKQEDPYLDEMLRI